MGFLGENNFCSVGYFVILGVCFKDENLVLAPGFAGQGEGNHIALFSGVDRNSVDMQVFSRETQSASRRAFDEQRVAGVEFMFA